MTCIFSTCRSLTQLSLRLFWQPAHGYLLLKGFKAVHVGTAVALGICSHLVFNLVSHTRDIVTAPFLGRRKFGLGLYEKPNIAFVFETIYGIFCPGKIFGQQAKVDYGRSWDANCCDSGTRGTIQLSQRGTSERRFDKTLGPRKTKGVVGRLEIVEQGAHICYKSVLFNTSEKVRFDIHIFTHFFSLMWLSQIL